MKARIVAEPRISMDVPLAVLQILVNEATHHYDRTVVAAASEARGLFRQWLSGTKLMDFPPGVPNYVRGSFRDFDLALKALELTHLNGNLNQEQQELVKEFKYSVKQALLCMNANINTVVDDWVIEVN